MQPLLSYPLDHIGIATKNIEDSIAWYQSNLGLSVTHREVLKNKDIELAFLALENTKIELLHGLSKDGSDTISRFITQRGPGLHHLCYRVSSIKDELLRLKSAGLKVIDEVPRPGAEGTLIAFIHPESCGGVLTELCESVNIFA